MILGQYIVMLSRDITSLHVCESNVKFNAKIKSYPDGSAEILCADRAIFGGDGWEEQGKDSIPSLPRMKGEAKGSAADVARARRRAAARVRDIALCNRFSYFVTLTLSAEMIDRYDIKAATAKLRTWLDNRVRRQGLKYVLVPEHHKDGAIHFHGFFNDALPLADSGTVSLQGSKKPRRPRSAAELERWLADGGQMVYNIPDWSLGYTTAIALYGDYEAAIAYTCKYIGKEGDKIGGRWYYSGGDLAAPVVEYAELDFRALEAEGAYRFDVAAAGLCMCILRIKGGESDYVVIGGDRRELQSGDGTAAGSAAGAAASAEAEHGRRGTVYAAGANLVDGACLSADEGACGAVRTLL